MPPGFKDSFINLFYVLHSLHISLHIQNYRTVMWLLYILHKQSFNQISQLSLFFQKIRQDRHCIFNYIVKTKHAGTTHIPPALWYSNMTITGFNWFNCFYCALTIELLICCFKCMLYFCVLYFCVCCMFCVLYVVCMYILYVVFINVVYKWMFVNLKF